MSLILLLSSLGHASRVYWTAPPSEENVAAVTRTIPDVKTGTWESLATGDTPPLPDDPEALPRLRQELATVRPLLDAFDGELQIMSRLTKATADVHALHSPVERDLFHNALLLTGFAVSRYYQDKLGGDPAALPYRTGEGPNARINAWLDAAGLYGAPPPSGESLPEAPQRLAFDALQALVRGMPSSTLVLGTLASGATVTLDGVTLSGGSGARISMSPGRHFWEVDAGGMVLVRADQRVGPGVDVVVNAAIGPVELESLRQLCSEKSDGWQVPPTILPTLQAAREPVYLAVPGKKVHLWRVDVPRAESVRIVPPVEEKHWSFRGTVGAGWVSTGDWLLQNQPEAPSSVATVNAATPSFSAAWEYHLARVVALGVGMDAMIPLGEFHELPTGSSTTRAMLYPHAALGVKWAQLTVGPLFPWYLGVGARAHVPIWGPLELFASGLYGMGLERPRVDGPTFEPLPLWSAWGGVSFRFDG